MTEDDEIRIIREGLLRLGARRDFVMDLVTRDTEGRTRALASLGTSLTELTQLAVPVTTSQLAGWAVVDAISDLCEGKIDPASPLGDNADWQAHVPRFYCGVEEIDAHSGLYGIVGFGGAAGAGKSMLAASAAITTAMQQPKRGGFPPRVFYIAAEMDSNEVLGRLMRISDGAAGRLLGANLHPILTYDSPKKKLRVSKLLEVFSEHIHMLDEMVLVVIDSVNSLAEHLGGNYWAALSVLEGVLITLRRLTAGRFAALCISELNQDGELKGRKIEYAADMVFRLTPGSSGDDVEVECTKGRSGGRRKYGTFRIDWRSGAFVPVGRIGGWAQ